MSDKKSGGTLIHAGAGALSGITTCILLQPFDLLKTRMQQNIIAYKSISTSTLKPGGTGSISIPQSFILKTTRDVIATDGISGLWRGTIPTLLRNVPGTSLYFYFMNRIRLVLAKVEGTNSGGLRCSDGTAQRAITEIPKLSAGSTMVTGSLARASAGFVLMPATVLKVRYESNLYKYGSLWNAVGNILKTDGIKGFFSGAVPTAIRDAPYAGIYLFLYERIKTFERDTMSKRNIIIPEALVTLSSGMVSGITASYITQPFDMVKTRIQIQPNLYSGMFNSFVRIFKEEGIQGFFRGISLRVLRKGIQAGISFTLYEWVLRSQAKK